MRHPGVPVGHPCGSTVRPGRAVSHPGFLCANPRGLGRDPGEPNADTYTGTRNSDTHSGCAVSGGVDILASMPKPNVKPPASGAVASEAKHGHKAPAIPVLADGTHSLTGLRETLGKPDEAFQRLLFRNHTEAEFYAWGVEASSQDILEDAPRFISSSLRILGALSPAQQSRVKLPPGIFALLADEAARDGEMAQSHATVSDGEVEGLKDREARLKKEMGRGIAERDGAVGGLRHALGDARVEGVRLAARDASSAAALAKGLRSIGMFITKMVAEGSDEDRLALDAFGVGAACAAEMEALAKGIEDAAPTTAGTGRRVSQRMLDIQDGRVLVLMDIVLRAFRLARRSDRSILLPELNRLAALFDTRSRASGKDAEGPAAEPEKKPS